jgi:hypothetical protein
VKKLVLLVTSLLLILAVAGCGGSTEIVTVEAKVYDLQFEEAWREKIVDRHVKTNYSGEAVRDFFGQPVYETDVYYNDHPAEYWVFLLYEGLTCKINNEELYRLVKKGETTKASVFLHYDDNGNLENRQLGKYQPPTEDKNREKIKGLSY